MKVFLKNENEKNNVFTFLFSIVIFWKFWYNYVSNNPKNVKEFPENLFINNVFVESDKETGNIKKKGF